MSDICTGIEDRGPHSVDLGENECPRCRIHELEAALLRVLVSEGSHLPTSLLQDIRALLEKQEQSDE